MRHKISCVPLIIFCLGSLYLQSSAEAIGLFVSSTDEPIQDISEDVIFIDHEDDTVSLILQASFSTKAEKFTWLFPVQGNPTLNLSSSTAFDRLQLITSPQYALTTHIQGDCDEANAAPVTPKSAGQNVTDGSSTIPETIPTSNVDDYQILQTDLTLADPLVPIVSWLKDNGYKVTSDIENAIRSYVKSGSNLVAFRLKKTVDTGLVRPVIINYKANQLTLPFKLSELKDTHNRTSHIWTIGPERSVTTNYRSLILNEMLIDWFRPFIVYSTVLDAAVDEAGGRGFVTEMVEKTANSLKSTIFHDKDAESWEQIKKQDWTNKPFELVRSLSRFANWDGLADSIAKHAKLADGLTPQRVAACPACAQDGSILSLDIPAFIADLEKYVIAPMRITQELLLSRAIMTRQSTRISRARMTIDPIFIFKDNLPTVSNIHRADQVIECTQSLALDQSPWQISSIHGKILKGSGTTWPVEIGDKPANLRIEQYKDDGTLQVVKDNSASLDSIIEDQKSGACQFSNQNETSLFAFALVLFVTRWARSRR